MELHVVRFGIKKAEVQVGQRLKLRDTSNYFIPSEPPSDKTFVCTVKSDFFSGSAEYHRVPGKWEDETGNSIYDYFVHTGMLFNKKTEDDPHFNQRRKNPWKKSLKE